MANKNLMTLAPGQINLDWVPVDWPLTPLGPNKNPYTGGWQNKPFTPLEIALEIQGGDCHAVGLLSGPAYNHPYGLVWVDVDGPSVYKLVEEITGQEFGKALPDTLTIKSGKEGRERKLYKLRKADWETFVRNKYVWYADENREKLEVLWKRHQGVLMGSHPETDGYFTPEGQGFEWVVDLPELPRWILDGIQEKNEKQGMPSQEQGRVVGPGFAINSRISLERDIQLATEATWALPPEAADDYDIWITTGQALHSLDESLLEVWDDWSKQSDKYKEGECHKRWLSFSKGGGRSLGSLIHIAKQNGWTQKEDYKALPVDDDQLDHVSKILETIEEDLAVPAVAEVPEQKKTRGRPRRSDAVQEGGGEKGKQRNVASSVIADVLLQVYQGNLLFSIPHNQFFMYEKDGERGLWAPMTKIEMLGDLRNKMLVVKDLVPGGYSSRLINDLYEQLQASLCFKDWYEGSDYLLFSNGVLNISTRELLPFNRELHLTLKMPYPYDPAATCEEIVKWLKHTQHDSWERTQVLRAWLRATLLGRYEIQKFMEIVGPGKSGKSTYANLAVALVGKRNVYSTDFENLEKNRFEAAGYMGKKLLLFQDADRWGGSVSKLKAITGNDWIRAERKYQNDVQEPFQFKGLVIITANEAIQSTDYTSGLERRRLTIPFDRPFRGTQAEQRELIKFNTKGEPQGDFAPLLPGLVNWLLDMSEEDMREYLMETTTKIEFFRKYSNKQKLLSNPILDWLSYRVVYDPGASSVVGIKKYAPPGSSHQFSNADKWLYASYAEFCLQSGVNVTSRTRFESLLLDICTTQLKLNVFAKRVKSSVRVFNIAIRESDPKYELWPNVVEIASDTKKYQEFYGVKLEAKEDSRTTSDVDDEEDPIF